jgi:hypothetical protein
VALGEAVPDGDAGVAVGEPEVVVGVAVGVGVGVGVGFGDGCGEREGLGFGVGVLVGDGAGAAWTGAARPGVRRAVPCCQARATDPPSGTWSPPTPRDE